MTSLRDAQKKDTPYDIGFSSNFLTVIGFIVIARESVKVLYGSGCLFTATMFDKCRELHVFEMRGSKIFRWNNQFPFGFFFPTPTSLCMDTCSWYVAGNEHATQEGDTCSSTTCRTVSKTSNI